MKKYLYYSDDGSMSFSDLAGLLDLLGFQLDTSGRDSTLGPNGRFVTVIPKVVEEPA